MSTRAVTIAEVARLLQIMASRPNLRRRRRPGDLDGPFDAWFDGGAARTTEGVTAYQFGDGTRARVAETPRLSITVELGDGSVVTVEQR